MHKFLKLMLMGVLIFGGINLNSSRLAAQESPFVSTQVEGNFFEVLGTVKDVIIGMGINIAHTLPASQMLNRTGPTFGLTQNIYVQAETIEFCSARISHMLSKANHRNILLCPFTISVYVLTSDPAHVHLAWRKPVAEKNSEAAVAEVEKLLKSIIEEATSW